MRKLLILTAVAASLALAACGDDDEDTTAATTETTTEASGGGAYGGGAGGGETGGGETVEISETEFTIDPKEASVAAGEVTFAITNDGTIEHNLEIEGNGVEEVSDTIAGGESTDLTVDLEAGNYEMYCNIGTHAEQGMEGEVIVE